MNGPSHASASAHPRRGRRAGGAAAVIGGLLVIVPVSASGQVVSLQQLRAKALQGRPELAMQDARLASAEARVEEARAPQRPKVASRVELSASPGAELVEVADVDSAERFIVAGSKTVDDGLDAFDPQLRYSARVGVTWNVWDFGRTAAATQAARAELRARQAEAAQTRDALVAAVDEVFIEWLGAHERARLEARTIQRLQDRITNLNAKVSAGGLAPSALLPIEADLAAAELRRAYADGAVELARLAVEEAVAQPMREAARPDPALLDAFETRTGTSTPGSDVDRTAEVLAARADAARASARLHGRRYSPQLNALASVGLRGQLTTLFPFYSAGVGLEIPLYDGGEGGARAAAARADAAALDARLKQRRTELQRALLRRRLRFRQAQQRVVLAERLVSAAETQLDDAAQRYEESAAAASELVQAQAQSGQAAAQLLTAKLDRARAALDLQRNPAP